MNKEFKLSEVYFDTIKIDLFIGKIKSKIDLLEKDYFVLEEKLKIIKDEIKNQKLVTKTLIDKKANDDQVMTNNLNCAV